MFWDPKMGTHQYILFFRIVGHHYVGPILSGTPSGHPYTHCAISMYFTHICVWPLVTSTHTPYHLLCWTCSTHTPCLSTTHLFPLLVLLPHTNNPQIWTYIPTPQWRRDLGWTFHSCRRLHNYLVTKRSKWHKLPLSTHESQSLNMTPDIFTCSDLMWSTTTYIGLGLSHHQKTHTCTQLKQIYYSRIVSHTK